SDLCLLCSVPVSVGQSPEGSVAPAGGVMAVPAISDSVGRLGANKKEDVITIQKLLNAATKSALSVTGICDEATIKCIEAFQKTFLPSADGRIDVGGQTIARLAMLAIGFVQLPQAPDPSYYSISP